MPVLGKGGKRSPCLQLQPWPQGNLLLIPQEWGKDGSSFGKPRAMGRGWGLARWDATGCRGGETSRAEPRHRCLGSLAGAGGTQCLLSPTLGPRHAGWYLSTVLLPAPRGAPRAAGGLPWKQSPALSVAQQHGLTPRRDGGSRGFQPRGQQGRAGASSIPRGAPRVPQPNSITTSPSSEYQPCHSGYRQHHALLTPFHGH